jgi:hypothetical protein
VAEPTAEALATCVRELAGNRQRAAEMGEAGRACAAAITWDGAVEKLVAAVNTTEVLG